MQKMKKAAGWTAALTVLVLAAMLGIADWMSEPVMLAYPDGSCAGFRIVKHGREVIEPCDMHRDVIIRYDVVYVSRQWTLSR